MFPFSDGVMSEISLIHKDDINWFITQDETHHEMNTKENKGGSTTTRYTNNWFPRSGEHVVKNLTHTTGIYGYTFGGEPFPPLYILSTGSKNWENYKFDSCVCEGLPMPQAKIRCYGRHGIPTYSSLATRTS